MDNDGRDDLVTLDDSGDLNILYGSSRQVNEVQVNHVFIKKRIESGFGIELSSEVRNDGGAFSYK